ncbi:unnamed protein product [Protopolystoma xenopodis]|uniref:Uncharacterized protein n=1 Tax=Protopolystoma xenopodis TaxID=117903 RepID=A0A3S5FD91_9PLAT|nr:unnamed protein product [Protopolystoma xenopodis]
MTWKLATSLLSSSSQPSGRCTDQFSHEQNAVEEGQLWLSLVEKVVFCLPANGPNWLVRYVTFQVASWSTVVGSRGQINGPRGLVSSSSSAQSHNVHMLADVS